MTRSITLCCCVASMMALLGMPVKANDAVSTPNFKVEGLYGSVEGETGQGLGASAAVPVGKAFGLQADGLAGRIDPVDVYGGGLHAFWRDSQTGLLGLAASYGKVDTLGVTRVGAEGEYYFKQFTVKGSVGYQTGDIDDSGYGAIQGQYYVIDDLALCAGEIVSDEDLLYAIGAEYQTSIRGLTCFASAATGKSDYDYAFVGLRFYFGGEHKTLIKRHREDNVANGLFDAIPGATTGGYGAGQSGGGGGGVHHGGD